MNGENDSIPSFLWDSVSMSMDEAIRNSDRDNNKPIVMLPDSPRPESIPKCRKCGHELKYHKVFGCLINLCSCKVFQVNLDDITTENLEKWK